jgi:hypothetical protein
MHDLHRIVGSAAGPRALTRPEARPEITSGERKSVEAIIFSSLLISRPFRDWHQQRTVQVSCGD